MVLQGFSIDCPVSRVLALIPAHDEAPRLAPVVREAARHLPVLVIDDGSRDPTADIAAANGAEVVRHAERCGKGAALRTGFVEARRCGFDAVLALDGDGQHDAAEIPALLAVLEERPGVLVIGERSFVEMPWPRCWIAPLGARLLRLAIGTPLRDTQSGFRAASLDLLERMRFTDDGYHMEIEMVAEALRLGAGVAWTPARTIYGAKKPGFRAIVDTWRFVVLAGRLGWARHAGRING